MESEVADMSSNNSNFSFWKLRGWLIAVLIIVSTGIALAVMRFGSEKSVEYYTEPAENGSLVKVVNATGIVEPVVTVQVGSQVSGQIQELYADYNSIVKRGQLLAKIDPRNFQAQVADAQASLAAAKARERAAKADLGTMQANLVSARANLNAARVTRDNDALNYKRYQEMLQTGIIANSDYDNVRTTAENSAAKYEQAQASVEQAQAQITAQEAQVAQAGAQVKQAQADLDDRRVNLEYTNIFSPVDGVVISRNVDVGQTVAAGLQAPLLFVIANDLTRMQVNASVDEADIGLITSDVDVQFTVDAFPNRTFSGNIQEVRLDPQTVQNVVTYSAIIAVDNRELYLKPGMTANITMTVEKRENVLKIPNAALRYEPQGTAGAKESGETGAPVKAEEVSNYSPESRPTGAAGLHKAGTETKNQSRLPELSVASAEELKTTPEKSAATATPDQAPGQLWDPSRKIRFSTAFATPPKSGEVWTLDSRNRPVAHPVKLGITDGIFTEMVVGDLHDGEPLIIADTSQVKSDPTQTSASMRGGPFGSFRRR
jgi:HlyD family secretion protein